MQCTSLLATTEYRVANQLIIDERSHALGLIKINPAAQFVSKAAIAYLEYLTTTWMPEPLWQSWSHKGRSVASVILRIPVEGVLPTTNHLESFNSLLKRKYIPQWQCSRARLRFDFLINILITHILPDIFANRRAHQQYLNWLTTRFSAYTGGMKLPTTLDSNRAQTVSGICWWGADQQRDSDASALLRRGCLGVIAQNSSSDQYETTCSSSSQAGAVYQLELHRRGCGRCTCPDFSQRGGACKHLRAFRSVIDDWIQRGLTSPFFYPNSLSAAKQLQDPPPEQDPSFGAPTLASSAGSSKVNSLLELQMLVAQSGELADDIVDSDTDCAQSFVSSDDSLSSSFYNEESRIPQDVCRI